MISLDLNKFLPAGADYTELKVQENRNQSIGLLDGTITANATSSST